ncbi:MAG: orotate phosphoribosyltransferase [Bacteroidales bacterium]|jgi:orotate phosphoribosyltransferase|nr:orotate phosphoribosyltransferase [Bacteroidales bacterium]
MLYNNELAYQVAKYLLEIKAVKLNPGEPFTWASGIKSPIYCDNRKTLSYPDIRTFLAKSFADIIRHKYPDVQIIAGVATGAIAIGVLVAQELNLPFIYIRSSQKDHGMQNQIEGDYKKYQKVVIVEDLVSTGMSSLAAFSALQDAEMNVLGMVAIYTYNLTKALKSFEEKKCELITLTDYDTTVSTAIKINYIESAELDTLIEWKKDPASWYDSKTKDKN